MESRNSLTLSVQFDLHRSFIDRIMLRPIKTEVREVVFDPLNVYSANWVKHILYGNLPVKFRKSIEGESQLTFKDFVTHQKDVIFIIGFGLQNDGFQPSVDLLTSIEKNFTYENMAYGFFYTIAQSGYSLKPVPKTVKILKYTPESLRERVRQLKQDLIGEPEPTIEQFGDMIEALEKAKNVIIKNHAKH